MGSLPVTIYWTYILVVITLRVTTEWILLDLPVMVFLPMMTEWMTPPPVPHILVLPVMVTLRVMTEWMTARPSLIYSSYL
jgi:hypothetical protein